MGGEIEWDLPRDPEAAARAAGLAYVGDDSPGIRRRRCGRGFTYTLPGGSTLTDPEMRGRVEALAVPPAWTDVWICPDEVGHVQATGRDDRGRKQYLYHERWSALRNRWKFRRLLAFGYVLPRLRRRVGRDLARKGLSRPRVLAAAVRILDRSAIRVGSPEYADRNHSYGLTTLRRRHVEANGKEVSLEFLGKSGKRVRLSIRDESLTAVLRETLDLPGWRVLKYVDEEGNRREVGPDDVNAYLRNGSDEGFSAKDFRTWTATVGVVARLLEEGPVPEEARLGRWLAAVDAVADTLANTRAVVRASYLHPELEPLWVEGLFPARVEAVRPRAEALAEPGRRSAEGITLALLESLAREDREPPERSD